MVTPHGDTDFSKLVNLCLVNTFSFILTTVSRIEKALLHSSSNVNQKISKNCQDN